MVITRPATGVCSSSARTAAISPWRAAVFSCARSGSRSRNARANALAVGDREAPASALRTVAAPPRSVRDRQTRTRCRVDFETGRPVLGFFQAPIASSSRWQLARILGGGDWPAHVRSLENVDRESGGHRTGGGEVLIAPRASAGLLGMALRFPCGGQRARVAPGVAPQRTRRGVRREGRYSALRTPWSCRDQFAATGAGMVVAETAQHRGKRERRKAGKHPLRAKSQALFGSNAIEASAERSRCPLAGECHCSAFS